MSSITVFCGSDKDPELAEKFYETGQMLVRHFDLVRFGGDISPGTMMGDLARGVLDNKGRLEGVISADYWPDNPDFPDGMRAIRVESEIERNHLTLSSDHILIGPGQIGTLYEGVAALSFNRARVKRGEDVKPVIFLNLNGFFNKLTGFLEHSFDTFNEPPANRDRYYTRVDSLEGLERHITQG